MILSDATRETAQSKWNAVKQAAPRFAPDLVREAYGALADWRTALQLLSRIVPERYSQNGADASAWFVRARQPDNAVVDSFFRHLVKGKQPALGHRLLQSLGSVLRFPTILTTNFDDLIEEAFARAGESLQRFEVGMGAGLPAARLVLAQRSIVKLHGGQYGLRADYSLDEAPTRADQWNFLGYLAGRPLVENLINSPDHSPAQTEPVALLVAGMAAQEERTRELLKTAFRSFKRIRVFWLGYSKSDIETFRQLWREAKSSARGTDEDGAKAWTLTHTEQSLLLLDLYQHCMCDLPPAGAPFPALWNIPFPPLIPKPPRDQNETVWQRYENSLKGLLDRLTESPQEPGRGTRSVLPVVITTRNEVYGGISVAASAFEDERMTGWFRIWLDLDDIAMPDGVVFRIQLTLAKRCGVTDPIINYRLDQAAPPEEIADRIFRLLAQLGQPCIVFLNSQQGTGVNSFFESLPAKWKSEENMNRLIDNIQSLSTDTRFTMRFVIICRDQRKASNGQLVRCNLYDALQKHEVGNEWVRKEILIEQPSTNYNPLSTVNKAIDWASNLHASRWRPWLLLCIVRFRIGRYRSGLIHTATRYFEALGQSMVGVPSYKEVGEALKFLLEIGVIRRKYGGILWMHFEVRESLEKELCKVGGIISTLTSRNAEFGSRPWLPELLLVDLICRHYGRLLLSAAEPMPAFEAMRHAFHALRKVFSENVLDSTRPDSTRTIHAQDNLTIQIMLKLLKYARLLVGTASDLLQKRVTDQLVDSMLKELHESASRLCSEVPGARKELGEEMGFLREEIRRLRLKTLLHQSEFKNVLELASEDTSPDGYAFCAAALIGLRQYSKAEECLKAGWRKLWGSDRVLLLEDSPIALAREFITKIQTMPLGDNERSQRVRAAAKIATRWGYFYLNTSLATYLANEVRKDIAERERTERPAHNQYLSGLQRSKQLFEFALELMRSVPCVTSATFRPNTLIRAHLALIQALLAQTSVQDEGDQWIVPLKALSDAEAFVVEYPAPDDALGRAILELRRGDILLRQVVSTSEFTNAKGEMLENFYRGSEGEAASREMPADFDRRCGTLTALLYEALRALERAEEQLNAYPKSRWWWWTLLVLRSQIAEALFVLRWDIVKRRYSDNLDIRVAHHQMVPPVIRSFFNDRLLHALDQHSFHDFFQMARLVSAFQSATTAQIMYCVCLEKSRGRAFQSLRYCNQTAEKVLRRINEKLEAMLGGMVPLEEDSSQPAERLRKPSESKRAEEDAIFFARQVHKAADEFPVASSNFQRRTIPVAKT